MSDLHSITYRVGGPPQAPERVPSRPAPDGSRQRRRIEVLAWSSAVMSFVAVAAVAGLLFAHPWSAPPAAGLTVVASSAAATPAPASDPYAVYLASNPAKLVLSREDAQARALLGCGKTWAPGTIDAVLAEAYRPTGICSHH